MLEWGKKVAGWLHFCKLGSGHHEVIRMNGTFSNLVPEETRYEALWWERRVKIDGSYSGLVFDAPQALAAATKYADGVSIGSMTALRRFLETSLRKTDRPSAYVDRFALMLTKGGRDDFHQKLKTLYNCKHNLLETFGFNRIPPDKLESIIKLMMGYTRKRNLLVPAWADDAKIWERNPVLSVS